MIMLIVRGRVIGPKGVEREDEKYIVDEEKTTVEKAIKTADWNSCLGVFLNGERVTESDCQKLIREYGVYNDRIFMERLLRSNGHSYDVFM